MNNMSLKNLRVIIAHCIWCLQPCPSGDKYCSWDCKLEHTDHVAGPYQYQPEFYELAAGGVVSAGGVL